MAGKPKIFIVCLYTKTLPIPVVYQAWLKYFFLKFFLYQTLLLKVKGIGVGQETMREEKERADIYLSNLGRRCMCHLS